MEYRAVIDEVENDFLLEFTMTECRANRYIVLYNCGKSYTNRSLLMPGLEVLLGQ